MQGVIRAGGTAMLAIRTFQTTLAAMDKDQLLEAMKLVESSPMERAGMIVEKVLNEDER